ncbi:D-arabinono-1,4-lactone oxidase [Streptomyces spectabilis]|uniref:FAD-binding protein n=1 Tax=Streptomyces spectabilis TaxID=68270 RepID=A0A5P2XHV8_STRST|nr:D-arabinono-1,4-lactone oxidase [Streptomyces spectabilis]MBB5104899.1 L-gulonolactone oxidase [Streptomyces spectabilis]MCI3905635.1 FAD-binding protein [Streptomyces spectabilis]QEV62600.1 FAD-binding protein [Streptomyces spectabilis]
MSRAASRGTGAAATSGRSRAAWRNWAGTVSARPAREATPASVDELVAAVRGARADGLTVKPVGSGHSFTAAAATDGLLIRPDLLTGIRAIDHAAGTVTVEAGTPLKRLNAALAREGLSLTNMGDIMEQTVSGAVSTGTHGTGRDSASIAAQITALELVTADGEILTCSPDEHPDVFAAARVGLGALGVISAITFSVEPLFLLRAREEPMTFDEVTRSIDELVTENEHFEFYWFPHTDNCNTKRNNRSLGPADPPGTISAFVEDELLSNGLFQVVNSLGRAVPATIPSIAKISSKALSARTYTDIPYKVFTSPRRVRFVEMEYAVPREALVDTLRELRTMIERSPLRVSFPVEVRTAPADDITLSTASGRDSAYIAVHLYKGTPFRTYFSAAEQIFVAHEGRPHWGKLHTRDAAYFAEAYPRFAEFTALRDRLDPDRLFANAYLRRVLGD